MGQQTVSPLTPQSTPTAPPSTVPTLFESTSDSIRVEVPDDWIIQDVDNAGPAQLDEEVRQGYGILMQLCPEEQATAAAASPASTTTAATASGVSSSTTNTISSINASRCLGAQEVIHIIRYPDLDTGLSANNSLLTTTTIDNVLTYHLQKLQEVGYRSMRILNSTDTAINIINPQTNETITTVPGKLVEMTYSTNFAPNEMKRGYFILTAANETIPNIGTTKGYSVFYEGNSIGTGITATTSAASSSLQPTPLPTAVKQTFDSFELIAVPEATQSVVQTEQTGQAGGVGQVVQSDCDPSYPDVCIPPPPPNLNCDDIDARNFEVVGSDPHGFDGDNDGIGCESGNNAPDEPGDGGGDDDGDEGGGGEPEPEPEPGGGDDNGGDGDDDDGDDNGGDDDEGEGGGGGEGNPNEFDDCVVPPGMDPGDIGC